jgi:hypothetical protein
LVWRAKRNQQSQSATQSFSADHITAVIRVYDAAGNVIDTHEHAGELEQSKNKPKTKGRQWASP